MADPCDMSSTEVNFSGGSQGSTQEMKQRTEGEEVTEILKVEDKGKNDLPMNDGMKMLENLVATVVQDGISKSLKDQSNSIRSVGGGSSYHSSGSNMSSKSFSETSSVLKDVRDISDDGGKITSLKLKNEFLSQHPIMMNLESLVDRNGEPKNLLNELLQLEQQLTVSYEDSSQALFDTFANICQVEEKFVSKDTVMYLREIVLGQNRDKQFIVAAFLKLYGLKTFNKVPATEQNVEDCRTLLAYVLRFVLEPRGNLTLQEKMLAKIMREAMHKGNRKKTTA